MSDEFVIRINKGLIEDILRYCSIPFMFLFGMLYIVFGVLTLYIIGTLKWIGRRGDGLSGFLKDTGEIMDAWSRWVDL